MSLRTLQSNNTHKKNWKYFYHSVNNFAMIVELSTVANDWLKKILKPFPCQPSRKNIHEKKSPLHVQKAIALTHNFNSLSFQLHARNVRRPGLLATNRLQASVTDVLRHVKIVLIMQKRKKIKGYHCRMHKMLQND